MKKRVRKLGSSSSIAPRCDITTKVVVQHFPCFVGNDIDPRVPYFKVVVFAIPSLFKEHHPLLISANSCIRPCQDDGKVFVAVILFHESCFNSCQSEGGLSDLFCWLT